MISINCTDDNRINELYNSLTVGQLMDSYTNDNQVVICNNGRVTEVIINEV